METAGFEKTVLIIDDSRLMQKMLSDMLRPYKFNILIASHGSNAMEIMLDKRIDCIFLDLLMPDITGIDILNFINDKGLKIPVIVVSADIQETTRNRVFELGAFAFLNKPPCEEDLDAALRKCIL